MGKRLIVLWVVFAAVCLTVIPAKSFAAAFNRFDTQSYIIHVRFSPEPLRVGNNTAIVRIKTKSGKPVQPLRLYLRTLLTGMQIPMSKGLLPWQAVQESRGRYRIPFQVGMFGTWKLELLLDQSGSSRKIYSIEKTVQSESHFTRDLFTVLFLLAVTAILIYFFPKQILRVRTAISLILFLGLIAGGYAFAKTIKKSLWPGEQAYSKMGMKMNMNASNMGLSTREFGSAVPVQAEQVELGSLSETVSYPAYVKPDLIETIYPRVTGWLLEMPFYPGMKVHAGETIGKLDTTRLKPLVLEAREKAEASAEKAQAAEMRLLSMKNAVQKAEASLDYWIKELHREKYLVSQGAVSLEAYQREKARYLEALNQFKALKKLKRADYLQLLEAEKEVRASQAVLKLRKNILSYSKIKTNISGIVTKRFVNRGVLVSPGMRILQIEKDDFVRVQARVAESDLSRIHVGTPVILQSPVIPHQTIRAKVTSIFYTANLLTHTGIVEARVPNLDYRLFPGEYVTMRFILNEKSGVLTVPSSAILAYHPFPKTLNSFLKYPKLRYYVWIIDKHDLAHRQFVIAGFSNGEKTEIVEGLNPGDWVVYRGWQNLQEMQPVKIVNQISHQQRMKMPSMSGMRRAPGMKMPAEQKKRSSAPGMKESGAGMKGMKSP